MNTFRISLFLVLGLLATRGIGCDCSGSVSSHNLQPVAKAGPDQTVPVGELVELDGSQSSDPDGDDLSYSWEIVQAPENSQANLTAADQAVSQLTPDMPGVWEFQLVVYDGELSSEPDLVQVEATAQTCQDDGDCDDSQACTNDSCDATNGCQNLALTEGSDCGTCAVCDATGSCVDDLDQDGDCPVCQECGPGETCVNQETGFDAKEECPEAPCSTGTCDGAGACGQVANGTACGDVTDTDCDNPDSCQSGICTANQEPAGTRCGDPADSACTNPDICDGAGICLPDHEPAGTACGDITDTECTDPDTCDGAGFCLANHVGVGTSCGDSANTECDDPDACNDSGICLPNHAPQGTSCSDNLYCNGAETCDVVGVCQPRTDPCGGLDCDEDNDQCGCSTDGDCPVCQVCNLNVCENVTAGTDPKNDCDPIDCHTGDCTDQGSCELESESTPCGDTADSDCSDPDTCNAFGICETNHEPDGTTCSDTVPGDCNAAQCGGNGTCDQAHALENSAYVCRPATGLCDAAESCDGVTSDCPGDQMEPASVECRPAPGDCDIAENCDGLSPDCPADELEPDTTECRVSLGDCDPAELCDGLIVDCPADELEPDTTECRVSLGDCDPAEFCDGLSVDCPADDLEPDTTECRPLAGDCDIADFCDGLSADCPADAVEPDTTECRGSPGDCDPAENCDGSSVDCPADILLTTECNPSTGECDPAEVCDGVNPDCPPDIYEPWGTPCTPPDACTRTVCDGGNNCIEVPGQVEVIPTTTKPGLRRISGNGQFGPVLPDPTGAVLPFPLVVQLNESAPCDPCQPQADQTIRFEVWPYYPGSADPAGCGISDEFVEGGGTVCTCNQPACAACARCLNYCYGYEGFYPTPDTDFDLLILRACNDAEGMLIDPDTGSPVTSFDLLTDRNGQASIELQLPDRPGMTVISATYLTDNQQVVFSGVAVQGLADSITVPTATLTATANPALGPLGITNGSPSGNEHDWYRSYLGDLSHYTLSITHLAASTPEVNNVPAAPLEDNGTLTISLNPASGIDCSDTSAVPEGPCFAASGNQVWLAGNRIPAAEIVSESQTEIVINLPEGSPGAASIVVADGSSTPIDDWEAPGALGDLASRVVTKANFWRVGPKPVFINAYTPDRAGTETQVILEVRDLCDNLLAFPPATTLEAFNPDKTTASNAVFISSGPDANGLATVSTFAPPDANAGMVRSAYIIGVADGVSSEELPGGNGSTVVTTVPHAKSPADYDTSGIGNDDGKNSVIMRVGDETPSSDISSQNPNVRISNLDVELYTAPDGSTTECFQNESHFGVITLTGDGSLLNLGVDGPITAVGTGISVLSGSPLVSDTGVIGATGQMGSLVYASLNVYMAPEGVNDDSFAMLGIPLPGWFFQDGSIQRSSAFSSDATYLPDAFSTYRNTLFWLIFNRDMPIDSGDPCP